jgi:preprotein translocase subunit SecG
METLLTILHVIVCLFLMLTVLLQSGKGGGMGAAFGGGNAATVFGGSGASSFLRRVTAIAGTVFMLTSMVLAYLASHSAGDSLEKFYKEQQAVVKQKEELREKGSQSTGSGSAGSGSAGLGSGVPIDMSKLRGAVGSPSEMPNPPAGSGSAAAPAAGSAAAPAAGSAAAPAAGSAAAPAAGSAAAPAAGSAPAAVTPGDKAPAGAKPADKLPAPASPK